MITADFFLRSADLVVTCAGPAPRRGAAQRDLAAIADGAIAGQHGTIVFVGRTDEALRAVDVVPRARVLDARGRIVVPGFVDPHTHVVYAGDRRGEFRRRLAGATYAEIAAEGGGILATVRATRAADEAQLVAATMPRLDEMLRCGTTTCEAKSGYGLELDTEIRMLRAIRALDDDHPIDLVPTFLGAHEIPPEFRTRRHEFIRLLIDEMIPQVAAGGLAEWCDVFCDAGVYTPAEAREILYAAARAGLGLRIHADELAASGGSLVAAEVGARSADHLLFADRAGMDALAKSGTVATLLPTAAFYLKLGRFAPARALIETGVPVALATDVNPGGGFSPSMPFAMALACCCMNMTLEEALVAATLNAAYALNRQDRVGSLEVGKQLDAVVVRGDLVDLVRVGAPAIESVIKRGAVVAYNPGPGSG